MPYETHSSNTPGTTQGAAAPRRASSAHPCPFTIPRLAAVVDSVSCPGFLQSGPSRDAVAASPLGPCGHLRSADDPATAGTIGVCAHPEAAWAVKAASQVIADALLVPLRAELTSPATPDATPADDDELFPGEDPASADPKEAAVWLTVYGELLAVTRNLLSRRRGLGPETAAGSRRDILAAHGLRIWHDRLQSRYLFWTDRVAALRGSPAGPDGTSLHEEAAPSMDAAVTLLTLQDADGLETSGAALVDSDAQTGGHGAGLEAAVRGSIATMAVRGAVEVVVIDDSVFLTGAVESADDIDRLVRAALMVEGVDRVVPHLVAVLDVADPPPLSSTDFEAALFSGCEGAPTLLDRAQTACCQAALGVGRTRINAMLMGFAGPVETPVSRAS